METSMIHRIHALRRMNVAELGEEWQRLYGEPARSSSREHLWRRLAWRVQELAHGGLSATTKARIAELVPEGLVRPAAHLGAVTAPDDVPAKTVQPRPVRDPRLPSAGTVLTRQYHGREIRVLALDDGFEWEGHHYRSLSAVAKAVTGQKWNGLLFFGLTERSRRP